MQTFKMHYCMPLGTTENVIGYYCTKEKSLMSTMEVVNSTFWFRLKVIIGTTASKSQSPVEDVDTNSAERFNSVIAKFVGGKRVNFSFRRAYKSRCAAWEKPKERFKKDSKDGSKAGCEKKVEP